MATINNNRPTTEQITDWDIDRIVTRLSHRFEKATERLPHASRPGSKLIGNTKYEAEKRLAYYADDIKRGPRYIAPKIVQECERWIASLEPAGSEDASLSN